MKKKQAKQPKKTAIREEDYPILHRFANNNPQKRFCQMTGLSSASYYYVRRFPTFEGYTKDQRDRNARNRATVAKTAQSAKSETKKPVPVMSKEEYKKKLLQIANEIQVLISST